MAGKRVSLASLAQSKVEAVPGASRPDLIHVHPDTVAPTPLNPRRTFDETELVELGEDMRSGQLQPCVAVGKAAYLKLYPEHADQLPDACRYVMAAGERRWRAAVKVGLDTLDLMLRHDLTESRVRFLAAVLSENVQRANFNPIEEADGLRAMLDLHNGNQAAAARAMGKSKQWFNQRIGLLRLSDQMVELVFAGKLTAFRDMRRYASLPPEEQYATWKRDQEQPDPPKPALPKTGPHEPQKPAETYTAVYTPSQERTAAEPMATTERYAAVDQQPVDPRTQPSVAVLPQPSPPALTGPAEQRQPKRFPYDNGTEAAEYLILKMPREEFKKMLDVCNEHWKKQSANVS
ncbi:ParB/RepB/Spo0J family partition protein [Streptomyces sp. NPDC057382]|uniref:ParB/RepB/Spo0J family partition protein n=1 Tax=unclassified Streptomyces TaxID=2593676 RepID=UPI00362D4521